MPRRRIPAARFAVAVGFMSSGVAFASWVVRIPDVQAQLGLSEGELGMVLLAVAAGGLAAMPLSSVLISRFGSRLVARWAGVFLAISLAAVPRMPGALLLAAALLVLGAATSVLSVALNTEAAALERRMRRPIMAGLHALYSVGGLAGASAGGLAAGAGVGASAHLGVAAMAVAGVALAISRSLLGRAPRGETARLTFVRPGRPLLLMGTVAFCVLFGEGALADWSAVYLRETVEAGPTMAAAGYAAFSLWMAVGRFVGDALTIRLGSVFLVRLGAVTAATGMVVALVSADPMLSVAGFGAVGAGLSTIYPTVLAAAGRLPGAPAAGSIAVVSSMGYVGLLAGPPLIGLLAEVVTLRIGFASVALTSAAIVGLSAGIPGRPGVRMPGAGRVVVSAN